MRQQICLNGIPLFWFNWSPVCVGDDYEVYFLYDYTNTGYGFFKYPNALDILDDKIIAWADGPATEGGRPDTYQHIDGRYYAVLNSFVFGETIDPHVAPKFRKLYEEADTHIFTTIDI